MLSFPDDENSCFVKMTVHKLLNDVKSDPVVSVCNLQSNCKEIFID